MKLVLARCQKKNRDFCLEVTDDGRVTNFIELTPEEKKHIPASFVEGGLTTDQNLLACKRCRTRRVASCSCPQNSDRCRNGKYNFDCIYCSSLELVRPSANQKIYVSSPNYDDIGQVLDALKLKYKPFQGRYDCDLLFINCGTDDSFNLNELSRFVANGGCVYISDQAASILMDAFPGVLDFRFSGECCKIYADVVDPELQQITGGRIQIEFDLSSWAIITDESGLARAGGKVLLRASQGTPYAGKPIMVSFPYRKGTVFYTCFHNHSQASEKEKMLLQLLLLKQIGASSNQSVEEVGSLMGLNISLMKEKFRR